MEQQPCLQGKGKSGHQNTWGKMWGLCDLVRCVGALAGAEPATCILHFDFEKVLKKTVAYCIQLAAFVVSGIAAVLFYCN